MAFTKATYDYLDSGGLVNWQLTAKTSAFTAVSGEGYLVDTSSAAVTVTLPASPSAGDEIIIVDYASNAGTNNITLGRNSLNIRGATDDLVLDNDDQTARLLYSGATKGWLVTTEAGSIVAAIPDLTVDYLVVAGGGGGASGGGGAGGLRTSYTNASSLNGHTGSSLTLSLSTDYIVTVGPGGVGTNHANKTNTTSGLNSIFDTITSTGGGRSGLTDSGAPGKNGASGGSGGGGAGDGAGSVGGSAVTSPVTQGYSGGNGISSSPYPGGGGGGASASGSHGSGTVGGNGGSGLAVNILNSTNATSESVGEVSGSDVYFSGGGGGGITFGTGSSGGSGGTGGGGNGSNTGNGENGSPNTGGGGGGFYNYASSNIAGSGGSGVVILRYPSRYSITVGFGIIEASGSPFTESTDKVSVFTGGTGTITFS